MNFRIPITRNLTILFFLPLLSSTLPKSELCAAITTISTYDHSKVSPSKNEEKSPTAALSVTYTFNFRLFGKNELKFSNKTINNTNYFAKRFAAKEAFAKALGIGFRNDLNFKDIEILNDKLGKPYYLVSKKINNMIKKKFKVKMYNLFLSISDEKDYSIAFTILQTK